MSYFDHANISNSDITEFLSQIGLKREKPENIQYIYDLGTAFHAGILQPHLKVDSMLTKADRDLIKKMEKRFWADPMCRDFAMAKDFSREREFFESYQVAGMEINARCKMDGARILRRVQLELKGVKVSSQKQFDDCLAALDYDRAVAHYQLTSRYEWSLMVGISKSDPNLLFKKLVKRHDNFYAEGEHKLIEALQKLHEFSPEDVKILV